MTSLLDRAAPTAASAPPPLVEVKDLVKHFPVRGGILQRTVGTVQAVALIKTIRESMDLPIFLNADHHYSFATVKHAIDAGFDAVIFGHTHHRGVMDLPEGKKYFNCGSWLLSFDYVDIVDGFVSLKTWK